MAKFIDYGAPGFIDWTGQMNQEINFRERFVRQLPQEMGFKVYMAVKTKLNLHYLANLGKILMPYSKGFQGGSGARTQQKQLVLEEFKAEQAYDKHDYKEKIWYEMANQGGTAQNSIDGTPIATAERKLFFDAVQDDVVRNFWLADKTKLHIAAGTYPDGTAFNIGDPDLFYNQIDGVITKLIADAADTPTENQLQRVQIGATLAADDAIAIMNEVFRKSKRELRGLDSRGLLRYYVTDEFLWNYKDSLQNDGTEAAHKKMVDGFERVTFNGIPLIPLTIDEFIALDFAPGTGKHFCLLSTPQNLALVLNTVSRFSETRFWFNPDENENRQRTQFEFGADYVKPELITLGYEY